MASEARQYAARNRQGSDWFTHGSSTPSSPPAAKTEVSEVKSAAVTDQVTSPAKNGDRTQLIKPKSDSNSWYKYEHVESSKDTTKSSETSSPIAPVPEKSPPPVTAEPSEIAAEPAKVEATVNTEPAASVAKVDSAAANNQQRSKAGMASDWFSHDHAESNVKDSGRQHGASKELGANAARMRGESEHWFSHDQEGQHAAPPSSARGRGNKQAANDSMHGIFHHGDSTAK